jgi:hypothetical protein
VNGRRTSTAVVLVSMALMALAGEARGQDRGLDEGPVVPAGLFRVEAGLAVVRSSTSTSTGPSFTATGQSFTAFGSGVAMTETAGVGGGVEVAVLFGLRLDPTGRALRADDAARPLDLESFGTGLSVAANPAIEARWAATRWGRVDFGLVDRVVLPTVLDPNVTESAGAWASVHLGNVARLDGGFDLALTSQSFAAGRQVIPSIGIPLALRVGLGARFFTSVFTMTRFAAASPYTSAHSQLAAGLGGGLRVHDCDVLVQLVFLDLVGALANEIGAGPGLTCRF